MALKLFLSLLLIPSLALGASRTEPPSGTIVVRAGTTSSGEFASIGDALDSLDDRSDASIFIYPGTYSEQVYIDRSGPLTIYGYTEDTSDYRGNQVTITAGVDAGSAGSNDASGTLRIHKDDFSLYNVDVVNSFGEGSQAIALSEYGSRAGFYGSGFYGYQDTLLANEGTSVYLKGFIEGATDFIFGREGLAYFQGNTINVLNAGWITANGRESDDSGSYVFESTTITGSGGSGATYLGRPWGNYAKVIFKDTTLSGFELTSELWSDWHDDDPRTDHILFADFNTQGTYSRPSFATEMDADSAGQFSIASVVGSDYADWVDAEYLS